MKRGFKYEPVLIIIKGALTLINQVTIWRTYSFHRIIGTSEIVMIIEQF